MLRITETRENQSTLRLRLDGTLNDEAVAEIETLCSRHRIGEIRVVVVDLAGVVFMNEQAAKKLLALANGRLRIVNGSPFIETLLKTVEG